ncbi:DUF922 domain-containing protein [Pseudofulvibacter geojedonensis]|uniref:DUF922 domain-containing protein n=1 Tax=Pseudofulvibacter geojedonensis TaxID=1123758 RepID=A0ABW3I576_9FLAO
MKKRIFILLLCFVQLLIAQDKELPWREDFKLTYSDFEGNPDKNHPYAAITYSGMSYGFSAEVVNDKVAVDYNVECFFVANKSWMKMYLADENLLAHEQLHFDITELYARKLRKLLSEMTFSENVKSEMRNAYEKCHEEKKAYQNLYDEETNHSKIRLKQKEWELKVAKELDTLKEFASK